MHREASEETAARGEARLDSEAVAKAFTGTIKPNRVSFTYWVTLAGVAFAMVMLPTIYLAIIGLTGYGIAAHAIHDKWMLTSGFVVALLYFIPLIAGLILLLFLVRPLFARREKAPEAITLAIEGELVLFALIAEICRQIRAPMPSRVEVDCDVNASARLRRGLLSRDLVLTIGLPLAACLEMRQFAGIIAHELGHFAQGAGMRLVFIVRSINGWFARILEEEDSFANPLERLARRIGLFAIVLVLAQWAMWLAREVMMVLVRAGHEMSALLLQQMEFDADRYEAKISGSEAFAETIEMLQRVRHAAHSANADLWQNGSFKKLPDDLPLLIKLRAAIPLSAEARAEIADIVQAHAQDRFSTHPPDAARLSAAQALNEPGVFHLRRPASELFADFTALSHKATLHAFTHNKVCDLAIATIVPAADLEDAMREHTRRRDAVRRFYGEVSIANRPLFDQAPAGAIDETMPLIAQWRQAKEQAQQLLAVAESASRECLENQARIGALTVAINLLRAGFMINATEFHLPAKDSIGSLHDTAIEELDKSLASQSALASSLEPFIAATRARILSAVELLEAEHFEGPKERGREARRLIATCSAIDQQWPSIYEAQADLMAADTLWSNRGRMPRRDKFDTQMATLTQELDGVFTWIGQALPQIAGAGGGAVSAKKDVAAVMRYASSTISDFVSHHFDVLGRLVLIVEDIEPRIVADVPSSRAQAPGPWGAAPVRAE
jgi:Zn-dependent protease with chaperone function